MTLVTVCKFILRKYSVLIYGPPVSLSLLRFIDHLSKFNEQEIDNRNIR